MMMDPAVLSHRRVRWQTSGQERLTTMASLRRRRISRNRALRPETEIHPDASPVFDHGSIPPDCCAIPLTNGGFTLVDEEDFYRVADYDWSKRYAKTARTWYAVATRKIGEADEQPLMHRFLYGLTKGDRTTVDHVNHNGLDNRRSKNLRLATSSQNVANTRKIKPASSRYRGVVWVKKFEKWLAVVTIGTGATAKRFTLGHYEIESEAAFAWTVAAPLLKDPDFLEFAEIPQGDMPSPRRQEEIKVDVIARVKARLTGKSGRTGTTSRYTSVSHVPRDRAWRALIRVGNGTYYLGMYSSEVEAAHAVNCGWSVLKPNRKSPNAIRDDEFGPLARRDEIREEVAKRIDSAISGQKTGFGTTSRYRGATRVKEGGRWATSIVIFGKQTFIGRFATEVEAAIAYNIAVSLHGGPRHTPNEIDPADLPSVEVIDAVREKVLKRFALLGIVSPNPG
jgi:hypothetical protein